MDFKLIYSFNLTLPTALNFSFDYCRAPRNFSIHFWYLFPHIPLTLQPTRALFLLLVFLFFFLRFYLFIHERHTERERERERGRDTGRGISRLHARSPMWDLILGLQDHTLGWRQALNRWATQGSPVVSISLKLYSLGPFLSAYCI